MEQLGNGELNELARKLEKFFEPEKPMTVNEVAELRKELQGFQERYPEQISLCEKCFERIKKRIPPMRQYDKTHADAISFDLAIAGVQIFSTLTDLEQCFMCQSKPCEHCQSTQGFRFSCPRCERIGCYECMPEGLGILCPECIKEISDGSGKTGTRGRLPGVPNDTE